MKITQDEIFSVLKDGLVELFEIEPEKIHPQSKIYEDLDIDSIDAIDLIGYMKEKVGYRMKAEDFKNVVTLEDISKVVEQKLSKNDPENI